MTAGGVAFVGLLLIATFIGPFVGAMYVIFFTDTFNKEG